MNLSNLITHLQHYRWPQVWQQVRSLEPNSRTATDPLLAIKAMLLAGWWQEKEQANLCIAAYPTPVTDPLTHFALSYATICLGDKQRLNTLRRYTPHRQPQWIRDWLHLETLGRAGKTSEQMQQVRRLLKAEKGKVKKHPSWLATALLQSNESPNNKMQPLRDWLLVQPESVQSQPLYRALAARCGMQTAYQLADSQLENSQLIQPLDQMPPPLLYRYALVLITLQTPLLSKEGLGVVKFVEGTNKNNQLLTALSAYDALAKTEFIDLTSIQLWLTLCSSLPQGWQNLGARFSHAINLVPRSLVIQGTVAVYALIHYWRRGQLQPAQDLIEHFADYLHLPKNPLIKNSQIFFLYTAKLCAFRRHHSQLYALPASYGKDLDTLVVIGESHSLSPANLIFNWEASHCKALSAFVMGIKMHHATSDDYQGQCLGLHLRALKSKPIHLLLTIGEIDCRPDEGIWPTYLKQLIALNRPQTKNEQQEGFAPTPPPPCICYRVAKRSE